MKLLVLHRVPYAKIGYHRGIDHTQHDVTYIGTAKALETVPAELRCTRVVRPGRDTAATEVIGWARAQSMQFDRVISMSEYELLDAASVREILAVPGPRLEDVRKVRDKLLMKELVAAAGVPVPAAMSLEALIHAPPSWCGKTVLKPTDGASSEDVMVFASVSALVEAVRGRRTGVSRIDERAMLSAFEAEQFVSGPIVHFDGLVWQGNVQLVVGSRYVGTCLSYAAGQPLGSVQFSMGVEQESWVQNIIRAVGIEQGSFHLEAIEHRCGLGQQLVFLEIANRVGGADVVDTFELATGVHMPSVELAMVVGQTPHVRDCQPSTDRFGWFVFPGHHLGAGTCQLLGHESYRHHASVYRWNELDCRVELPRHITYQASEVPVSGVIRATSHDEGAALLRQMFADIRIQAVAPVVAPERPDNRSVEVEVAP